MNSYDRDEYEFILLTEDMISYVKKGIMNSYHKE